MKEKKSRKAKLILFWMMGVLAAVYFILREKDYIQQEEKRMISYDILQNLENNCFELLNATTGMISGSNEKSMGKSHQNIVRALRKIVIANEMMGKGIICISGLQGAGKSTLMKNFYGLSDEYFNIKTGVGEKIPVFICENGECKGPEMYAMTLEN